MRSVGNLPPLKRNRQNSGSKLWSHHIAPIVWHPLRSTARYQNFKITTVKPPPQLKTSDWMTFLSHVCIHRYKDYIYIYMCVAYNSIYILYGHLLAINLSTFFQTLKIQFLVEDSSMQKKDYTKRTSVLKALTQPKVPAVKTLLHVRSPNKKCDQNFQSTDFYEFMCSSCIFNWIILKLKRVIIQIYKKSHVRGETLMTLIDETVFTHISPQA